MNVLLQAARAGSATRPVSGSSPVRTPRATVALTTTLAAGET